MYLIDFFLMILCYFRMWWLPVWQQWQFLQPQLSKPVPRQFWLYMVHQTRQSNYSAGAVRCKVSKYFSIPRMSVITLYFGCIMVTFNSKLCSWFVLITALSVDMMMFTSMMAPVLETGFWERHVTTPKTTLSIPPVIIWLCASGVMAV